MAAPGFIHLGVIKNLKSMVWATHKLNMVPNTICYSLSVLTAVKHQMPKPAIYLVNWYHIVLLRITTCQPYGNTNQMMYFTYTKSHERWNMPRLADIFEHLDNPREIQILPTHPSFTEKSIIPQQETACDKEGDLHVN